MRQVLICLELLAAAIPTAVHGEVVDTLSTVLLYRHRPPYGYPAGRSVAGDADGFIGSDTR